MSRDYSYPEPPDSSRHDRAREDAEREWDGLDYIERAEALADYSDDVTLSDFIRWLLKSEEMTRKDDETKEARMLGLYCACRFMDDSPARRDWIEDRAEQLKEDA